MEVSVIIPTYNRKEILNMTLNSILNQDYPKNKFEIIVVDDGGNDGTDKMINSLKQRYPCEISYFYQERNGFRPGAARNIGIKNANSKILIFLDSDIVVVPNFISQHVNTLNKNKKSVVIGYTSGYDHVKREDHDFKSFRNLNKIKDVKIKNDERELFYKECEDNLSKLKYPWMLLFGNNFSIRKKDMILFDENFVGWSYEDIDLGVSLYENKIKFVLNRKALGFHVKTKKDDFCPHSNPSDDNCIPALANLRRLIEKHNINEVFSFYKNEVEAINFYKKIQELRSKNL